MPNPLVSVVVSTYNHQKYIADCLEGILMQQTTFPFEIILGEDESSDGTREICITYAEKHPDKIKLFLRSREDVIYIKGNPTGRYNFLENIKACNGKYIALCEGDDYWTDPLKLQKQVDFMEGNPEYNICFNRSYMLKDSSFILQEIPFPFKNAPFYYIELLRHFNFMFTASIVFRKPHNNSLPDWFREINFGDLALYKIVSEGKRIGCINDIMSVYRIHENGIWSLFKPIETKIQYLDFYKKIYFYLSQEEKIIVSDKIKKTLFQISKLKYPKNPIMNKVYYQYKLMIFNKYINT